MKIYESLLKLSSEQLESQLEKIKKGEFELDVNDMDVDIQINSKSEKDLNDVVLLNIFLLLKKNLELYSTIQYIIKLILLICR